MIKGKDIVCVTFTSWEANYVKSTVELMNYFAQDNTVLFVDFPHSLASIFRGIRGDKNVPLKRLFGIESRIRPFPVASGGTIHVLTTFPILPINWMRKGAAYDFFSRVNGFLVSLSIKRAMRKLKMKEPIVINAFNPYLGLGMIGSLKERALIYYGYDNINDVSWSRGHGGYLEERMMAQADASVFSSEALFQGRKAFSNNAHVVKNGVDFDLFYQASKIQPNNTRKKVGYIGTVDKERIDFNLLTYLANKAPDLDFEFVGRDISQNEAFRSLKNVTFHGAQSAAKLPGYMSTFDVVIIPFSCTSLTKMIYPMKINEYLAAGKPVVMTNFASLPEFASVVCTENEPEGFLEAIRRCINEDTPEKRAERIHTARNNSWQNRAEAFSSVIETLV